jgi:ATP-binding cassette, subfamily C (CFTR/MRP), member 1
MSNSVLFSRIMDEYGTIEKEEEEAAKDPAKANAKTERGKGDDLEEKDKKDKAALMQEEERNLGAVSWETYAKYLKFGGTLSWGPFIFGLLMMVQGAAGKRPCVHNEKRRLN